MLDSITLRRYPQLTVYQGRDWRGDVLDVETPTKQNVKKQSRFNKRRRGNIPGGPKKRASAYFCLYLYGPNLIIFGTLKQQLMSNTIAENN